MKGRSNLKTALVLTLLALVYPMMTTAGPHTVHAGPAGGPYVPWQALRDVYDNASFFLQNLENSNVWWTPGSSVAAFAQTADISTQTLSCAFPPQGQANQCYSAVAVPFTLASSFNQGCQH